MTDIKLSFVSKSEERQWQSFIEQSINGIFYHDLNFVNLYAFKAKEVINLTFKKGDKLLAVLTGGIIEDNSSLVFSSPFSASFTGFCYVSDLKLKDTIDIIRLSEEYMRERGVSKIVLQHPPIIYYKIADERFDYALNYFNFKVANVELTFYLSSMSDISSSAMRNIKKAERTGLIFKESDDCKGIWNFLHQQKTEKGFYFSVSLKELTALKNGFGDRVRLFGVYKDSELLSAMVLYSLNRRVVLGFAWAQSEEYQIFRPTDYLIYNIGKLIFSEGYRHFDLGTGTINGEPVWGVTRFKENYSPASVIRKKLIKVLS